MPKHPARPSVWVIVTLVCMASAALWYLAARNTAEPAGRASSARSTIGIERDVTAMAQPRPASSAEPSASATAVMPATAQEPSAQAERPGPKPIPQEVAQLRTRVLDTLAKRQPDTTAAADEPPKAKRAPAREYPPGNMKDRTGELNPETMRVLNHEFLPLVDECYDQAHERNPNLRGMLGVSIHLAGAEELGTIIESLEPAPGVNVIADDELIECVRQSAFTLKLPMPLKSGRTARQLTMPFGEPEEDERPAGSAEKEPAAQP